MSEAYGKAMVADVVLSLSRKPLEKSTGTGRLFVAKNRAGRDGILFPIHLNTATSKLVVLDNTSEMSLNEVVSLDNINLKKTLKEKWKQINNDS